MIFNTKKVINMEEIKRLISTELYEFYMTDHQELKILQMPMSKRVKFIERLYIDIKKLLLVFLLGFWYFLFIKDNA